MKTPLRYAGGKSKAYKIITEYLPEKFPKDRIISPFLGGGSLESRWSSELGIKTIGFDAFEQLIVFWCILLQDPQGLADRCRHLVPTKEEYKAVKEELLKWNITQQMFAGYGDRYKYYEREPICLDHKNAAAYYYFNHNLSYGPMFLGWMSKIYESPEKWERMCKRVEEYRNPNLTAMKGDYTSTLDEFDSDFLYLDPPYYLEKDKDNKMFKGMYPNCNFAVHHDTFNHEGLMLQLSRHKGPFILSYNNCETIRDWYSEYEIVYPEWHYSYALGEKRIGKNKVNNDPKKSHEILIIKR